jgi:hypothetical protein
LLEPAPRSSSGKPSKPERYAHCGSNSNCGGTANYHGPNSFCHAAVSAILADNLSVWQQALVDHPNRIIAPLDRLYRHSRTPDTLLRRRLRKLAMRVLARAPLYNLD